MPINTANHLACDINEGKSQNTVRLESGGVVASLMKAVKELSAPQCWWVRAAASVNAH